VALPTGRQGLALLLCTTIVLLIALALPSPGLALPQYTAATGQPCSVCHVNPAGGGELTAVGAAFAAIPTHATNPVAAFQQVSGAAAQPTTVPTKAPTAPAATKAAATATKAPAATTAAASPTTPPAKDGRHTHDLPRPRRDAPRRRWPRRQVARRAPLEVVRSQRSGASLPRNSGRRLGLAPGVQRPLPLPAAGPPPCRQKWHRRGASVEPG